MTNKQEKALRLVKYFIPTRLKYGELDDDTIKAFFLKTDKGIEPDLKDMSGYKALLEGQRWMAVHEKMWREGFEKGLVWKQDFEDSPSYVKDFVNSLHKRIFGQGDTK